MSRLRTRGASSPTLKTIPRTWCWLRSRRACTTVQNGRAQSWWLASQTSSGKGSSLRRQHRISRRAAQRQARQTAQPVHFLAFRDSALWSAIASAAQIILGLFCEWPLRYLCRAGYRTTCAGVPHGTGLWLAVGDWSKRQLHRGSRRRGGWRSNWVDLRHPRDWEGVEHLYRRADAKSYKSHLCGRDVWRRW